MICINLMNMTDLNVTHELLLTSFILIYGRTIVAYNTYTKNYLK